MIASTELFFHSTARCGRLGFIIGFGLLCAVWGLALYMGQAGWDQSAWLMIAATALKLVAGYSALCVLSLRLHDCGRSGWWSWIILALLAYGSHQVSSGLGLTLLALGLIAVMALAVWPGQKHLNRHGPPPKS